MTDKRDDLPDPPYPADTLARGWRFEVDMETFKRSDTWKKARTGVLRGALLLLWAEAWQEKPCGTLPDDDELIALMIDMPAATFIKHRDVLRRGWSLASDGRLYHETITTRVLAMLEKRAKDAKRAASNRARRAESPAAPPEVTGASRVTHDGVGSEFDTKHQAPISQGNESLVKGAAKRAARRCPPTFEVTDELRQWAAAEVPGVDIDGQTRKFRDHTFKNAYSDWPATWRNWMRTVAERMASASPPAARPGKHSGFATKDYREGVTEDGSLA